MAQQFSNVKMNALSEFKLRLMAPPQQGAQKQAALSVNIYKNNPRLVVKTNVPNDKDYGKITAAMDSITFFTLLHLIRSVAAKEGESRETINNLADFVAGRKMDSPLVVSKTIVGKSKEGVMYISVVAKDRPMIKFDFMPTQWHTLVHEDGSPWGAGELSVAYANGWCKLFEEMIPAMLIAEYVEPDMNKGNNNGGGNGGGGGWNNNNGGGSNQRQNNGGGGGGSNEAFTSDDDLPF